MTRTILLPLLGPLLLYACCWLAVLVAAVWIWEAWFCGLSVGAEEMRDVCRWRRSNWTWRRGKR